MTAIPPSRYKVVERGRRLVVIDTRTGQPATREHIPARAPSPSAPTRPVEAAAPSAIDDRSGSGVITTSRFYDLKGPRRIVMTEEFSSRLGKAVGGWLVALFIFAAIATLFSPWLWIAPAFILFQPKPRAAIRQWITARLDDADQAAS